MKPHREPPPDFDRCRPIPTCPTRSFYARTAAPFPRPWRRPRPTKSSAAIAGAALDFGKLPPDPANLRATVTATLARLERRFAKCCWHSGRATLHTADQARDPGRAGPVPRLPDQSRPQPPLDLHGGSAGLYRVHLSRHGPELRKRRRLGRLDRNLSRYDFSCLARWAWSASRTVDYLITLPEVNRRQIGMAGHSRNGKQALLAAAFDERSARWCLEREQRRNRSVALTTEPFGNESIELLAGVQSHWFHPRSVSSRDAKRSCRWTRIPCWRWWRREG